MPMSYLPSFGPIVYDTQGRIVRQGVPTPIPQPVPTAPLRTMGPPVGITAAQGGYNQMPPASIPAPVRTAPTAVATGMPPQAAAAAAAQPRTLGGLLGLDEERFSDNALSMGLLGLGGQLLAAGGPQQMPVGLGQAFGQGVGGFMQGMQAGQQMDEQARQRALEARQKQAEEAYIASLPPEMQALAKLPGGLEALQKAQAEGKGAFAGDQPPSNMYEMAARLFPGDTRAQAEWVAQQQERGRQNININNTPEGKAGERFLTDALDQNSAYIAAGNAARSALLEYDELQGLLDGGLQTGAGQETIGRLRSLAMSFSYELPEGQVSQQAMMEAFSAISTRIILPQVKQLGVNPTDKDLEFVQQATPGMTQSVEGNRVLIDALRIKAERDKALADFSMSYWERTAGAGMDPAKAGLGFQRAVAEFMSTHPAFQRSAVTALRARFNQANKAAGSGTAAAPSDPLRDNGLLTE